MTAWNRRSSWLAACLLAYGLMGGGSAAAGSAMAQATPGPASTAAERCLAAEQEREGQEDEEDENGSEMATEADDDQEGESADTAGSDDDADEQGDDDSAEGGDDDENGSDDEDEEAAGCPDEFENTVSPGTLDDGQDLLPRAEITIEDAVRFARGAANGPVGEVDVEEVDGRLMFNVDIGDHDVTVDAASGDVVSVDAED